MSSPDLFGTLVKSVGVVPLVMMRTAALANPFKLINEQQRPRIKRVNEIEVCC